jgi:hypothetical protein
MQDHEDSKAAIETPEDAEQVARREFLKKVGKAAATAPAVALLLSAHTKSASAQSGSDYGGYCGCGS